MFTVKAEMTQKEGTKEKKKKGWGGTEESAEMGVKFIRKL